MAACASYRPHDKSTKIDAGLSSEEDNKHSYDRHSITSEMDSDEDILKTPKPLRTSETNKTPDSTRKRNNGRSSGRTKRKKLNKPRWHTQMYIMFLALRQHPKREASRTELIKAAVSLDKKISEERNLPRVFTGKTPMNSASACLTTNGDKYFIPFKPEGAKSTHFRLAYEPGNFESARAEYNKWMDKLIKHDWPVCFGKRMEDSINERTRVEESVVEDTKVEELMDEEIKVDESIDEKVDTDGSIVKNIITEESISDNLEIVESIPTDITIEESTSEAIKVEEIVIESTKTVESSTQGVNIEVSSTEVERTTIEKTESDELVKTETNGNSEAALTSEETPVDKLDENCIEKPRIKLNCPTRLDEIIEVRDSSIPNAGRGLWAVRFIPAWTPLGFYFGVPMTEDEFDSLKDGVGLASHYSIMYRRTVLDATDEKGMPFTDPNGPIWCPYHFMNEDVRRGNVAFLEGYIVNQIICMTTRDVEVGEELFAYYGSEVDRGNWKKDSTDVSQSEPDSEP
ncbi:hypothetical protein K7432_003999 [Basidiobolus ranarum]|uniref:SET domain-containing protein n=1 Tax=Basidiobolus ranarum TaxID=34480 RepID=A0ABR2WYY8_9FUNG